jgi:hypothetical protein
LLNEPIPRPYTSMTGWSRRGPWRLASGGPSMLPLVSRPGCIEELAPCPHRVITAVVATPAGRRIGLSSPSTSLSRRARSVVVRANPATFASR